MLLQIAERELASGIMLTELKGRLALGRESQRLESLVDQYAGEGHLRVIFDLTGVEYVDSAGIGLLALAAGKLKESGGKLAVVAAEGRVLNLLKLTQVNALMAVCPNVDAALGVLSQGLQASA